MIILYSLIGMWEYMQLYLYFDLPQAVVIVPIIGFVAVLTLKKLGFAVPVVTMVISVVYQMVENRHSSLGIVNSSKINIILNILPVILILMFLGIAGGFLVRVLINGKKSRAAGILCCVCGILLTFGGSVALFGNPLYPFLASHAIHKYAEKYDSEDYRVSEVSVFFSLEDLEYQGRVIMSDGYVYALYHEKGTGKVSEINSQSIIN